MFVFFCLVRFFPRQVFVKNIDDILTKAEESRSKEKKTKANDQSVFDLKQFEKDVYHSTQSHPKLSQSHPKRECSSIPECVVRLSPLEQIMCSPIIGFIKIPNNKMDNTNQEVSNGSPPKKAKLNGGEEDDEKVFTLNYNCFEKVFKWLGLKDLLNVRLTSKQSKDHADTYIGATYKKKFTLGYPKITIYDATDIYDVCRSSPDSANQSNHIHWHRFTASIHGRQIHIDFGPTGRTDIQKCYNARGISRNVVQVLYLHTTPDNQRN